MSVDSWRRYTRLTCPWPCWRALTVPEAAATHDGPPSGECLAHAPTCPYPDGWRWAHTRRALLSPRPTGRQSPVVSASGSGFPWLPRISERRPARAGPSHPFPPGPKSNPPRRSSCAIADSRGIASSCRYGATPVLPCHPLRSQWRISWAGHGAAALQNFHPHRDTFQHCQRVVSTCRADGPDMIAPLCRIMPCPVTSDHSCHLT